MSRLGDPARAFVRRNAADAGVRRSIAGLAQGLSGPVPFSEGHNSALASAEGIGRALGLATQTGYLLTSVGNYEIGRRREEAAEARRAEAIEKEKQDAIDAAERGQAVRDFNEFWPTIEDEIAQGNITLPAGQTPQEFARAFVADRLPDDVGDAYKERYGDLLTPRVVAALVERRARVRDRLTAENVSLIGDDATVTRDATALRSLVSAAGDLWPDSTETERLNAVVVPALRLAADRGDTEQFEAASEVLGDRFPQEIETQRAVLLRAMERRRGEASDRAHDEVLEMFNAGASPEAVSEAIDRRADVLDPATEYRLRATVESKIEEQRRATIQLLDAAAKDEFTRAAVADADEIMSSGLGAAYVEDAETVLPGGERFRISADDQRAMVRDQSFAEIAKRYPDDPDRQRAARIAWLSVNPTVTDPDMTRAFAGISRRISADAETAPEFAVAALEWFRSSGVQNARVRDRHLSDDDREFLRMAEFMAVEMGMDPSSALLATNRFLASDSPPFRGIDEPVAFKDIDAAASKYEDGAKNIGLVRDRIAMRARAYAVIGGGDMPSAIRRAAKDFDADYDRINGWWVRTRGRDAVRSIDPEAVGGLVTRFYAQANDEDAADLTLRPDDDGVGWRIAYGATGIPVPDSPVYSDGDLVTINRVIAGKRRSEAEAVAWGKAEKKRAKKIAALEHAVRTKMKDYEATNDLWSLQEAGRLDTELRTLKAATRPDGPDEVPVPDHLRAIIEFFGEQTPAEKPGRSLLDRLPPSTQIGTRGAIR